MWLRLGNVIDQTVRDDVGGAVGGDLDIFPHDRRPDVATGVDGQESQLNAATDSVWFVAGDPQLVLAGARWLCVSNAPVMVLSANSHGNGVENSLDGIVGGLGVQEVIDDSPGNGRPAIIQLPQQGSTAVSLIAPLPAPASVAEHHGLSLNDLSQVDVRLRKLALNMVVQ